MFSPATGTPDAGPVLLASGLQAGCQSSDSKAFASRCRKRLYRRMPLMA